MSSRTESGQMPAFRWTGQDSQGIRQKGQIQALNADLARAQLRRLGLHSVRVQRLWWSKPELIKAKDLSVMTRQWATMLQAGVPVVQALDMLCRSANSQVLSEKLQAVRKDVHAGVALHQALAKHPLHFSGLYVHMVQAGEAAGILEVMMERLSQALEKNHALRSKIRSALMYPVTVFALAVGILLLILTLVVPVFEDVFSSFGAELPWPTRLVVGLSDGLAQAWPLIIAMVLLGWWAAQQPSAAALRVKQSLAEQVLSWPVLGPLVSTAVLARWAQTLSALLSAGVPLAEALGPTAQACDHSVYARCTLTLQRKVAQGSGLSEAMGQTGRFPAMIVQLCATGEETGALSNLLARASGLMETELNDQVNGLTSLLEPLIIVVLGGFIGAILVAMYLPIFHLGQVF
ncbi:type II secretion system F family protein [Limnohabitans sp.]|uniref:type II secretion system F family protein n=1 Tax=Limnohabitans sp. TaxID=1907725 RepID=UPI0037BE8B66